MADPTSDPYLWVSLWFGIIVVGLVAIIYEVFRKQVIEYRGIVDDILTQNQGIHDELKQFNQLMKVMENTFQKFNASFKTVSEKFSEMNESLNDLYMKEEEVIKELKSIPKFIQRTDYLDKKLTSLESFIKATNNSQNAISKFNENSKAFQKTNEEQRKLIREMHGETSKLKDSNFLAKLINDPRIQDKDEMIQLVSNENEKLKHELNAEREEHKKTLQEIKNLREKSEQLSDKIEKLENESEVIKA